MIEIGDNLASVIILAVFAVVIVASVWLFNR